MTDEPSVVADRPVAGDGRGADAGPVRFGLLGARSWIADRAVIPAIEASSRCTLVAVAAAGGPVPAHLAPLDVGSYEAVLARPDVDAVYLPLPNGLHRPWVERAAAAGKHVLCEKPLGVDAVDAAAMVAACDAAGVVLAEAWMTPFGPRWAEVVERARAGHLGEVRHVRGDFTFVIDPDQRDNYRWDPAQGGGALLDVGIYALGAAVALWGAEPVEIVAGVVPSSTGVDSTTSAWCAWGEGRTASVLVSFELPECQRLELVGTVGRIVVGGPAFTGGAAATSYEHHAADGEVEIVRTDGTDPYVAMVEAFARAVHGIEPWPRPPSESVALARLLDRIRAAAGGGGVRHAAG